MLGRARALYVGWNDGAWGRPMRRTDPADAGWYDQGYRGGQVYRRAIAPFKPAPCWSDGPPPATSRRRKGRT